MKEVKTLYWRNTDNIMTHQDMFDSVFLADKIAPNLIPDNWERLEDIQINIDDSLIDDIINANRKVDFDSEINKYKAQIIRLEELRSKQ